MKYSPVMPISINNAPPWILAMSNAITPNNNTYILLSLLLSIESFSNLSNITNESKNRIFPNANGLGLRKHLINN